MSEVYPETPLGSPPAPESRAGRRSRLYGAIKLSDVEMAAPPAEPQPAPELAAAMAETRQVRDGYADLCQEFGPSPQSGMSARISLTVLNRHRVLAGLPELPRARGGDREDATMRYRRERDEARAERDRYRAALEAIAECRAGMPYPDAAREALEAQ